MFLQDTAPQQPKTTTSQLKFNPVYPECYVKQKNPELIRGFLYQCA